MLIIVNLSIIIIIIIAFLNFYSQQFARSAKAKD